MENLSPMEIIGWVLAGAAAINTLGSAVEKIGKAIKAAKAPDINQNGRLDTLENDMKEVKTYLSKDKQHLEALDEGNRVTQRALLALLEHGIDGNNIKRMQDAKDELQDLLINR